MAEQFKSLEDLQKYCNSQFLTIIELSKKITKLEEENKHLKEILEKSTALIATDAPKDLQPIESLLITGKDEEYIALTEIRRLKDLTRERDLSLEETKRLEIYTKILNQLYTTPKTIKVESRKLNNDDLLKMLEEENVTNGT